VNALEAPEEEESMKRNVGGWDQNLRFAAFGAALVFALFAPIRLRWRLGALSVAASEFITGSNQYCPINDLLGIDTLHKRRRLRPGAEAPPAEIAEGNQRAPAAAI
jgi:hypothetical protein